MCARVYVCTCARVYVCMCVWQRYWLLLHVKKATFTSTSLIQPTLLTRKSHGCDQQEMEKIPAPKKSATVAKRCREKKRTRRNKRRPANLNREYAKRSAHKVFCACVCVCACVRACVRACVWLHMLLPLLCSHMHARSPLCFPHRLSFLMFLQNRLRVTCRCFVLFSQH